MQKEEIEKIKNEINLELRSLLSIIDIIDGKKGQYEDYVPNTLDELNYLEQQLKLILEAKNRMINIFKE